MTSEWDQAAKPLTGSKARATEPNNEKPNGQRPKVKSVTGETASIALPELKRIDFEQKVDRQNAAAQDAAWDMTATPGSGCGTR